MIYCHVLITETSTKTSELIYEDDNIVVEAFYHDHANLDHNYAYRITAPDRVLVVMGDGKADDRLIEAAKNADVFVAEIHTRADAGRARWAGDTPEKRVQTVSQFHIMPDELAEIATKANVRTLVLYHTSNYSDPFDPEALLKEIRQYYSGRVELARDGDIF